MSQREQADYFTGLHISGKPVQLYNIWDAGSARVMEQAGASAVATGSWSVATAQGYDDGQQIPFDRLCWIAERICQSVSVPVTVDIEGGYAERPAELASNIDRILDTGAVGINFEDQIVGGEGLYEPDQQAARIEAIRACASKRDIPLFINARTDLFLKSQPDDHAGLIDQAIKRAGLYQQAGASGLFVPGLMDEDLIAQVCEQSELPVNVMMKPGMPDTSALSARGVSRISHGPFPYSKLMSTLMEHASEALVIG